jgi:hypothetical protein
MYFPETYTISQAYGFFDNLEAVNPPVPLPQVKSWDLVGPIETLTIFDLSEAEELDYDCTDTGDGFRMEFLPIQIQELYLQNLKFSLTALSRPDVHLMPNLTTLVLSSVEIEAPLYRYISFPQVRRLCLQAVYFYDPEEDKTQNDWFYRKHLPLSDALPFRNIPELECIYLSWMRVDGKFANRIQYCPKLQEFDMEACAPDEFIPSFTKSLAEKDAFPSLRRLKLDYSLEDLVKKEFSSYCAIQRPEMIVSYAD